MTIDEQTFRTLLSEQDARFKEMLAASTTSLRTEIAHAIQASEQRLKSELRAEFKELLAHTERRLLRKFEYELAIAIEHFDGKVDSLAEATSAVIDILMTKATVCDLQELRQDTLLIKRAVTANNQAVQAHLAAA